MEITRRAFVGCSMGVLTVRLAGRPRTLGRSATVRMLDLEEHCAFRESLAGYDAALTPPRRARRDVLIVPAVLGIPSFALRLIKRELTTGALVILESGAGFSADDSADFQMHRSAMRDLEIDIAAPVALWPAPGVPYIDFTWPIAARVRDFTRVVPIGAGKGTVVATVEGLPVGLARRAGRGMLVYLGSPIGIALGSGDAEARAWLRGLLDAPTLSG